MTTFFTSVLPNDVPDALLQHYLATNDAAKIAELYHLFAWQTFIALNWPVDEQQTALPLHADEQGGPQWFFWKERGEIFRADGATPTPWGSPRTLPLASNSGNPAQSKNSLHNQNLRLLGQTSKLSLYLTDDLEALGEPLWDQNGNKVYYEVLLNKSFFDTVVSMNAPLYNLDNQIAFRQKLGALPTNIFASGIYSFNSVGAIEIKLAWKILDESQGDIPERFFHMPALLPNGVGGWVQQTVGLVGMHITHKTKSVDKWVWATFEQVDNLAVEAASVAAYAQQGQRLKPSFFDPNCQTANGQPCPSNVLPTPDAAGVRKTQVTRGLPIDVAVAAMNQTVQAFLQTQGSVWQYYQLIGTQYTITKTGDPIPPLLTNPVLETYNQQESCMSCHAQAELATGGSRTAGPIFTPSTADFSWALRNAHWSQTSPATR